MLLLLAVGCGPNGDRGGDARQALSETAAKLGEIRSGTLDVRVVVDPKAGDAEYVGFEVQGPFTLPPGGGPAEFRIDYTRFGDTGAPVTLTAVGGKAFVTVGDETYALPAEQQRQLLGAGEAVSARGLERLAIDDWLVDPEMSDGAEIAGDETDRIEARLDVPNATRALLQLAKSFGVQETRALGPADAKRLREAAEEARIEVLTGEHDRLLRRLAIDVDLGLDAPNVLRAAFGSVVGAKLEVELTVENPNEPVAIEAPARARPASELPG
ncbi:MAG: hypothetical protein ICV59_05460 [Thermoleophilia bacterium]|nr:hypothetical protein [Thermoleophilia bacterium]